jgi:hypothetical protein
MDQNTRHVQAVGEFKLIKLSHTHYIHIHRSRLVANKKRRRERVSLQPRFILANARASAISGYAARAITHSFDAASRPFRVL